MEIISSYNLIQIKESENWVGNIMSSGTDAALKNED